MEFPTTERPRLQDIATSNNIAGNICVVAFILRWRKGLNDIVGRWVGDDSKFPHMDSISIQYQFYHGPKMLCSGHLAEIRFNNNALGQLSIVRCLFTRMTVCK
jgi:hypothetical protein